MSLGPKPVAIPRINDVQRGAINNLELRQNDFPRRRHLFQPRPGDKNMPKPIYPTGDIVSSRGGGGGHQRRGGIASVTEEHVPDHGKAIL